MMLFHVFAAAMFGLSQASAPPPGDAAMGERIDIVHDRDWGGTTCRFRAVPELELVNDNEREHPIAFAYKVEQTGAGERFGIFSIRGRRDGGGTDWDATHPEFTFYSKVLRGEVQASLIVDGRDLKIPFRQNRALGFIEPPRERQSEVVRALAEGKVAEIRLVDPAGKSLGHWTFAIATLRHVPRALRLSDWRCA